MEPEKEVSTPNPTSDSSTDDSDLEAQGIQPVAKIASRLSRVQSANAHHAHHHHNELEKPPQQDTRSIRGLRWFLICLSLYLTCFLYGLDTTIAADLQGPIIEQFGHVEQLSWVGAGFPLGSVSVILLVGAMYTSFNMKWTFVVSVLLFEIGSTICGAAPNMNALIVGRVIAGFGGSGIYLGCLNYFTALATPRERGLYITLTGTCWGVGAVLGPIIGGLFADSSATWRWGFYINLVVGAVTAPVILFWLPPLHPVEGVSIRTRVANLDLVGFVLGAAVWALFTVSFTMAGGQWAWSDGRTITLIVVFGVVLAAYAVQQTFSVFTTEQARSFPVQLLRSRTQLLLAFATPANSAALFVVVYFIPIYFQFTHDDSALMAAVRLLPFIAVMVACNVMTGQFLPRIRYYMPIYVVSGVLITLGSALLVAYFDPDTPQAHIYGFTVLIGIGAGLTVQIGYAVATLKAGPEDVGDAISLQNVLQIGASVISLVVAGQVFQSYAVRLLGQALDGQGFTPEEIRGAVAGVRSAVFQRLEGELRNKAVLAITEAMKRSLILSVVGGAVVTVSGLLMKVERILGEAVVA
jgi:MFS family permease